MDSVEMMGPASEEPTIVRRNGRAAMTWVTFEAAPETLRSPQMTINELPEFFVIQSIARH